MKNKINQRHYPLASKDSALLCFDADTDKIGIALVNVRPYQVLSTNNVSILSLESLINDILLLTNKKIICRLETPSQSTVYGSANAVKKAVYYESLKASRNSAIATIKAEKAFFNVVWHSARCFEISQNIKKIIESKGLICQEIDSQDRTVIKGSSLYSKLNPENFMQTLKMAAIKTNSFSIFPSKVPSTITQHIFGKSFNKEISDALFLAFPELIEQVLQKGVKI